jgi:hypothetical protein
MPPAHPAAAASSGSGGSGGSGGGSMFAGLSLGGGGGASGDTVTLMEMGFTQADAERALAANAGDVQRAAASLIDGGVPTVSAPAPAPVLALAPAPAPAPAPVALQPAIMPMVPSSASVPPAAAAALPAMMMDLMGSSSSSSSNGGTVADSAAACSGPAFRERVDGVRPRRAAWLGVCGGVDRPRERPRPHHADVTNLQGISQQNTHLRNFLITYGQLFHIHTVQTRASLPVSAQAQYQHYNCSFGSGLKGTAENSSP